jgi:CBS domain-containing protein
VLPLPNTVRIKEVNEQYRASGQTTIAYTEILACVYTTQISISLAITKGDLIMQLREIMTRDVEVVSPETTVKDAAKKMQQLDVGPLPVCDGERLLGMLTDRDITIRVVAEGADPALKKVRETMTPGMVYCFEDQDVKEAARLMEQHQIRRLPIINRDKRLVGIISLGDLAVSTRDQKLTGKVLAQVSEPAVPNR